MPSGRLRNVIAGILVAVAFSVGIALSYKPGSIGVQPVISATIFALFIGAGLAISASGLVVTYTTSGIFNFAHGAIGMVAAFAYWQLRFDWNVPAPIAFITVVFIAAPLLGTALEALLMRRLTSAPLVAQLVVTVALLFLLLAIVGLIWDFPVEPTVPKFFQSSKGFRVLDVNVSWHYAITIAAAALIAVVLRVVLFKTRTGITMRAVVDSRELAALNGAHPNRSSRLAWALSCSLAALAGVLLAPDTGLNKAILSFFAIQAFAAAILGRLKSLPLTFLGAFILGIAKSFPPTFLSLTGRWANLSFALPAILLFVALLFLPQDRLELRQFAPSRRIFRIPRIREAIIGFVGVGVFVMGLSLLLSDDAGLNKLTTVMGVAVLAMSLVPLTGWAGQVSLGQPFFIGVGFWGFGLFDHAQNGNALGFVVAGVVAALAGALVALPALRLKGLYLALATFAIASAATQIFYSQEGVMQSPIPFQRPVILGIDLNAPRSFLLFCCVVFGILGTALVALRRSRFGRRLVAMKDSPAACATLGVNLVFTKLIVFMTSAAIAGVAGGLLAMSLGGASQQNPYLDPVGGLSTVLFIVIGGVGLVGGAFAAGFFSEFINFVKTHMTMSPFNGLFKTLEYVGPALASMNIIANPDGIAGAFSDGFGPKLPWRRGEPGLVDPDAIPTLEGAGHDRPFSIEDLEAMDKFLGVPIPARLDLDLVANSSVVRNAALGGD